MEQNGRLIKEGTNVGTADIEPGGSYNLPPALHHAKKTTPSTILATILPTYSGC